MMDGTMMDGMMMDGMMMSWMWIFWILLFALVIGLVVVVVVLLARRPWASATLAPNAPIQGAESPVEILKRRYAQGEIESKDFERMRRQLLE